MSRYNFTVNTISFGQVYAKISHPKQDLYSLDKAKLRDDPTTFKKNHRVEGKGSAWELYTVTYSGSETNPPAKPVPFTSKEEVNKAIDEMTVQLDIQIAGMDAFVAQLTSLRSALAAKFQGKTEYELPHDHPLRTESDRLAIWERNSYFNRAIYNEVRNQRDMLAWIQDENTSKKH